MKIPIGIWITDTHLSEHTIEINRNIFKQVFTLCEEIQCKQIFHGGDIYTSRKGQPEIVLNTFKSILDEAAQKQISILAIAGNHDKTNYTSDSSFLDTHDGHPAFTVLRAGASLHYDNPQYRLNIFFLPYFDESLAYGEKLKEITDRLADDECNVLLTHVGVDGVKNNGHVNVENDLKQDAFDPFSLVLIGHYHDRQILGKRGQIVYTGSTHQANFGEDADKGCVVIYDDATYEFVKLDFPEHVTVEILPQDLDAELLGLIVDKSSEAKVKIKIAGDIGDDKGGMVARLEQAGVKIEVNKPEYSPVATIGQSQVAFTGNDILLAYGAWAEDRKVENAEFGKELLKQVM